MENLTRKAYGKLNLSLDIVGKRSDGYHLVRMIMQTVNLYDVLEFRKTKEPGIVLTTNRSDLPTNQNNLIYRAAALLMEKYSIQEGVRIHLKKHIPVAAGMAGGSADCAAALSGINTLFSLGLSTEELMTFGISLGADVPYCLLGGTALSEGIGEILTPLPDVPPCKVLLVKPDIDISTKWVYTTLDWKSLTYHPDIDGMISSLHAGNLTGISKRLSNVLESVTIPAYPIIQSIKETMLELGANNSLMSGSGSTVFGLYTNETLARNAYQKCIALYPKYQIDLVDFVNRQAIQE
ncbi:MAG: 4-(cytidine 5'-diphospho)-2-C-methyl-D-erythritol kinase [Lachnospiraceae bacterium]|nr:4-(cytidine 5'-diphospho)-2-C-methyl-D-erythritol kinase [Lachnospiraceae bacterium]